MNTRILIAAAAACAAMTMPPAQAQGLRAAAMPGVGTPQVVLVQKTTTGMRWRVWTGAGGVGQWASWQAVAGNPLQHLDANQPVGLAAWCAAPPAGGACRPRLNAFFPVVEPPGSNIINLAEVFWAGSLAAQPQASRHGTPTGLFDPRAALSWNGPQTSLFGLRTHIDPATGQPLFKPREYHWDGSSWNWVEWGETTVPDATALAMGPKAAGLAEGVRPNEQFLLYRETRSGSDRVMLLHRPNEEALDLGRPAGALVGAPMLLNQQAPTVSLQSLLHAFAVAQQANGERHLFMRSNTTPTTPAPDGTPGFKRWTAGWNDVGRPPVAGPPPAADDLEITAGIVWDAGSTVRINLFGTRWGRRVEYWFDGAWHWSVADPFPSEMGSGARIVDAVATNEQAPRLTVFAQASNGEVWEQAWSWQAGRWLNWTPLR